MNEKEFFEKIKSYKFVANKSLGQNFLVSPQTSSDIVSLLDIKENDRVLEIGAGVGALSYYLAQSSSNDVTLIDVDERMINVLNEEFGNNKKVLIKRQNILKMEIDGFTKIIGNLPYYITSGIMEHVLLNAVNTQKIVFMTQKEVYQKLTDRKEVSPLTLLLNYVCKISNAKTVNRNSFVPVPHVDSSYFCLTPNENIKNKDNKVLFKLMSKIFIHKRKTILNCLTSMINDKDIALAILKEMNVDERLRPEQLDIKFYINLLNMLKSKDFISKIL